MCITSPESVCVRQYVDKQQSSLLAMESKRYSLRSRQNGQHQTKLDFPCRRSGRSSTKRQVADKRTDENESPPKRTRVSGTLNLLHQSSTRSILVEGVKLMLFEG